MKTLYSTIRNQTLVSTAVNILLCVPATVVVEAATISYPFSYNILCINKP